MTEQPMQDDLVERAVEQIVVRMSDWAILLLDIDEDSPILSRVCDEVRIEVRKTIAIMQQDLAARDAEIAKLTQRDETQCAAIDNMTNRLAEKDAEVALLVETLLAAHDMLHNTTAVLSANDCATVAACMSDIRKVLARTKEMMG